MRKKQILNTGNYTKKKTYIDGIFEKIEKTGEPVKYLHYLNAPTGLFAIYTTFDNGNEEMNYILTDNLGSINVITDTQGNIIQQLNFDPWGTRRNPDTWDLFILKN